jgi:hypothetical protein
MTSEHLKLRLGSAFFAVAAMTTAALQPAEAQAPSQLPPYMNIIVGSPPPAETAKQDILALNTAMFGLYGNSGKVFQRNIMGQHPIILALFSGAGAASSFIGPDRNRSKRPPCRWSINC